MWNKIKVVGIVLVLLFFVLTNPHGAASAVHMIGHGLTATGNGLGAFFSALDGGGR